jgi:two-component system response regulator PilR (NtrC family)
MEPRDSCRCSFDGMNQLQSISLISQNETMREVLARVDTIASSESSVLLIGETGVGKELFAEYIHHQSARATGPLVNIGLAELPPELLESELFGHDKGAYTSAHMEKKGLFELANGGSIFLDDIDDFPLSLQSKLLRVLESREVKRVGGTTSIPLDVRLITASKIDLKALVDRGIFRADLFYRINVVPIVIPPLHERRDDIPLLVNHFLQKYAPEKNLTVCESAMRFFVEYDWPGNVRELRNIIQRISLFAKEEVRISDLPAEVTVGSTVELLTKACNRCFTTEQMSFDQVVSCLEVNLLHHALDKTGGNRTQAAQLLKMSPSTFRDKLKKYNLDNHTEATPSAR